MRRQRRCFEGRTCLLTALYVSQPLRWQTFMGQAQVLVGAAGEDHSGSAETVSPGDG